MPDIHPFLFHIIGKLKLKLLLIVMSKEILLPLYQLAHPFITTDDAYTHRYDNIINDIPCKVKIMDDTLLYNKTIEDFFYHTWDFLALCAEKGIVINEKKFKFCRDTIDFAGLKIKPYGASPSDNILSAIRDFPTPINITGARSWFGLVKVAWAYAISPIMQPIQELVKRNFTFTWNNTLDQLFNNSKDILISKVKERIHSFDTSRETILQNDWSKEGIGYLLLQKYCEWDTTKAPTCCPEGWKLVFAGSCFTTPSES